MKRSPRLWMFGLWVLTCLRASWGLNYTNYYLPYDVDANTVALWHFDEAAPLVGDMSPPRYAYASDATSNGNTVLLFQGEDAPDYSPFSRNNGFGPANPKFGDSSLDIRSTRTFGGSTHRNYEVMTDRNVASLAIRNNLTVEGWFYVTGDTNANANEAYLISRCDVNTLPTGSQPTSYSPEWAIYAAYAPQDGSRPLVARIYDSNGDAREVVSPVTWGDIVNKWVHVGMTYSGTELKLYVDIAGTITANTQTFETSADIRTVNNPAVMFLCEAPGSLGVGSVGQVDEVRISNTVRNLTVTQGIVHGTASLPGYLGDKTCVGLTFQFQPVAGGNAITQRVFLNGNGTFDMELPKAVYTVSVRGDAWLKKVLPDSVDVNGYVDLGSIELTGGDANGNNQIDSADLDIFSDNWGLVGQ